MKPRAFTLIELLVVIAIIGILASIILISLSSSRVHASDAGVVASLQAVGQQIEVDYPAPSGGYGQVYVSQPCPTSSNPPDPVFWTDSHVQQDIQRIANSSGIGDVMCAAGGNNAASASTWAIASPLPSAGVNGKWQCEDSNGDFKLSVLNNAGANDETSLFAKALELFTPKALALGLLGPNLGGGTNPAVCP